MTLNSPSSRSSVLHIKRSRIGNRPWAIDWHHDLWPWMTLNPLRSRSQKFRIKYLEYRERYNVTHNEGQIGNHQWPSDWHRDLWHWMTLNFLDLGHIASVMVSYMTSIVSNIVSHGIRDIWCASSVISITRVQSHPRWNIMVLIDSPG